MLNYKQLWYSYVWWTNFLLSSFTVRCVAKIFVSDIGMWVMHIIDRS
jgi:hypothetical protein